MTYTLTTTALFWGITASGCSFILGYWLRGRCPRCRDRERTLARKDYPHLWRRRGIND